MALASDVNNGLLVLGTEKEGEETTHDIYRYSPDFNSAQRISLQSAKPDDKYWTVYGAASIGESTYVSLGRGIVQFDKDFNQVEYRSISRTTSYQLINFNNTLYSASNTQLVEITPRFRVGKAVQLSRSFTHYGTTADALFLHHLERGASYISCLNNKLELTATLTASLGSSSVMAVATDGHVWLVGQNSDKLCVMKADSELDSRDLFDITMDGRTSLQPLGISFTAEGNAMITLQIDEGYGVLVLNNAMEAVDAFTLSNGMVPMLHYRDPVHTAWWTASRVDLRRPVLFSDGFIYSDQMAFLRGPQPLDEVHIHTSSVAARTYANMVTIESFVPDTEEEDDLTLTITDLDMSGVFSA